MTTVAPPAPAQSTKRGPAAGRMDVPPRRVLNVPLLVITLIVVAVVAPSLYYWHSYMLDHSALTYLDRAKQLEAEGEYAKSSQYIFRYLRVYPEDRDAHVYLARVYYKSAEDDIKLKPRSRELLNRAIGLAPDRDTELELRKLLIDLSLELRQFTTLDDEANKLLRMDPKNPAGLRALAISSYMAHKSNRVGSLPLSEVIALFEGKGKALERNPGDVQLYSVLAHIYREDLVQPSQSERDELANEVMDQLVDSDPENAEVYWARYFYRERHDLPGAQYDIDKAVELGPENFDILISAGEKALRNGREATTEERFEDQSRYFKLAIERYQKAIEIEPEKQQGYLGLGQAHLAQNKAGLAINAWRDGLKSVGNDNVDLNARIVSVLLALDRLDETEELLDALDRALDKIGPKLSGPARKAALTAAKFLRGKWYARKGEYAQAIRLLEQVKIAHGGMNSTARVVAEHEEVLWLLGESYEKTARWDRAALEYERLLTIPNAKRADEARKRVIICWRNAGRPKLAGKHIQESMSAGNADLSLWLQHLETEIKVQSRLPKAEQDWAETQAKLDNPPAGLRDTWQLLMLKADYIVARGGKQLTDAAIAELRRAEQLHPDVAPLFQRLTVIYQRLDRPDDADRAIREFAKLANDRLATYLLRAELHALRNEYGPAIAILLDGLKNTPEKQHSMLRYGLAQFYLRTGNADKAEAQYMELYKAHENDAGLVNQLAELAFERGKMDQLEKWEQVLRKLDGEDSTRWRYFRVLRLLGRSKSAGDGDFVEAKRLQEQIVGKRPSWPPGFLLQAEVAIREGDVNKAIAGYKQAIELGENRVSVFEQLIKLLRNKKDFAQANRYNEYLSERNVKSQSLMNLEIQDQLRQGDSFKAAQMARTYADEHPNDAVARETLGHVLVRAGRDAEAEEAFVAACKLAPNQPGVWNALISFYLGSDQKESARDVLEGISNSKPLEPLPQALLLGSGYQRIGDRAKAKANYDEAMRINPTDLNANRHAIQFYRGNDPDRALTIAKTLFDANSDDPQARRLYADELMAKGGEDNFNQAIKILRTNGAKSGSSPVDQRQTAQILLRRGGPKNRQRAIRILERLIAEPGAAIANDRRMIIGAYEIEGRIADARAQFVALVGVDNPHPQDMLRFCDFSLRQGDIASATHWEDELSKAAPDSLATQVMTARFLKARKRERDIEPKVEQWARERLEKIAADSQRQQLYLGLGQLYTRVENYAAAQRWFEQLEEANPKAYQPLVEIQMKQGRIGEGIRICLEKSKSDNLLNAAKVAASALTNADASASDGQPAEPLFAEARRQHPTDIGLLFSIALVRATQKRPEGAVELYREILESHPRHVPTLNNLAYVLLEIPGRHKEALPYIDQAIEINGRQAALLDTKGMALLVDSPKEAVALFEEATKVPTDDPRYEFHLAVAYHKAKMTSQANASLRKAIAAGLEKQALTATEQKYLSELR